MATLTAQILVGSPHPNHDGIDPTHHLFLSENDHPTWVLVGKSIFHESEYGYCKTTWIPTVENMLEDALLMIAVHVCNNPTIIEHLKLFKADIQTNRIEMYSDLEDSQRKQLYEKCMAIKDFPKLIVSVYKGSVLLQSELDIS